MLPGLLEKVIAKEDLTEDEAENLMSLIMTGGLSDIQVAGFLVALRSKKESATEISAFARVMRREAIQLKIDSTPVIDTCGTGGDKSNLINISTLSAIVLASMKVNVAKHGNRSVSSACGSADLLEHLGYPLQEDAPATARRLSESHFAFMFAPGYHPAMKYAIGPRKALEIRTVFNILGPLSNPAHAEIQLMGVYSSDLQPLMAESLQNLGTECALVVHSEEGLDEISPIGKTDLVLLNQGAISTHKIDATSLNLKINSLSSIQAQTKDEAFEKAHQIIRGEFIEGIEVVALNATAALYLYDLYQKNTDKNPQDYIQERLPAIISFISEGNCQPLVSGWAG